MPGAVTGAEPAAGNGVVGGGGGTASTAGRRAPFAADPFDQVVGSTAADGDRTWRPSVTTGRGVVAVLAGGDVIGVRMAAESGGATSARDHPGRGGADDDAERSGMDDADRACADGGSAAA